jgi:oligopeptide/dipeptide ABC transporter ATP-binding protein
LSLLEVKELSVSFNKNSEFLLRKIGLNIEPGQVLGMVGESGSGKTMLSLALMGLLPNKINLTSGSIKINGRELIASENKKVNRMSNEISMIFQHPKNSLNPTMKIGEQIGRVLKHNKIVEKKLIKDKTFELLHDVGIPATKIVARSYPHQLSGGMCQRVMIAMALACRPSILIADEPTTALDVTIQAQIFDLLKKFIEQTKSGVLFISHDLGAVSEMSDNIAVLFSGQMMEQANKKTIINMPKHPYTKYLIDSINKFNSDKIQVLNNKYTSGCSYSHRCQYFSKECEIVSDLITVNSNHKSSCVRNNIIK